MSTINKNNINITNNTNNISDEQYNEPESIILNLENLNVQYKNLLLKYKQAVANYTTFLQQESTTPCGKYTSNSTNIDQSCYNDIWAKSGCTEPAQNLSSISDASSTTLDTWITTIFNTATNTDSTSRMACYGHVDNQYMIISVGGDGYLFSCPGLSGSWTVVNDNSNGNMKAICTGSDGKTIIGINSANQLVTKSSWDAPNWQGPYIAYNCVETTTTNGAPTCSNVIITTPSGEKDSTVLFSSLGKSYCCSNKCYQHNKGDCGNSAFNGCATGYYQTYVDAPSSSNISNSTTSKTEVNFISIAQAQDGTLVAVGTDNQLWTASSLQSCWTNVATNTNGNEYVTSVCIGPNGRVISGNGTSLFYKESYQNLQNQVWQYACPGCCQDITVAPDGTFMDAGACNDFQIWTMDSYLNLDGAWKGPYPNTCCIISLTTVANTNYAASGYSSATQPNYNIDGQPLTAVQGQTFWGTGPIGSENPYTDITTVNDCQALCASTANCTGATFNGTANAQPMCWLRTGDGSPMTGLSSDYAIIPTAVNLLNIIDQINTQLMDINTKILKNTTDGQPIYDGEAYARKNKTVELLVNYESLQKERENIRNQIKQYEKLDREEIQGNMYINENYYSFLLLILLVILIIYILYKVSVFYPSKTSIYSSVQQGGGISDTNIYFLLFIMIVLIILFIYYQKIIQTTSNTLNTTASLSKSIFNTIGGGLFSGPVFNFN
jgi:hypothetical protein